MKMKRAYTMTPKAIAARKAAAHAARTKGRKQWVTMRVEPDAKQRVTDYVADPRNECPTLSEALRRNF